jgi:hypothetical protein
VYWTLKTHRVQLTNAIRFEEMAWNNKRKRARAHRGCMERTSEQGLCVETGTTLHGEQAKRSTYNVVEAWLPIQREVAWSLS